MLREIAPKLRRQKKPDFEPRQTEKEKEKKKKHKPVTLIELIKLIKLCFAPPSPPVGWGVSKKNF